MADRIILDFENDMLTIDSDGQKSTELMDLKERKEEIFAFLGLKTFDLGPAVAVLNSYLNGEMAEADALARLADMAEE